MVKFTRRTVSAENPTSATVSSYMRHLRPADATGKRRGRQFDGETFGAIMSHLLHSLM